ncbi:related to Protein kinase lkh1 [Melanopsichium pennsylvanicum]|uniref:Related to Protein kinase lkh1 n=2 Tax=Melanopsichium pennsylvanicum TaxID=63383 RepID=A0AAJ4XSI8_9BASI|nr:related to Protein kinase lkh1 [Melanopsichium pennsylvanicum 4]SNX87096.1 related to Protein kinase lkh1 [Melanopsichium pennsylvanicum]
MATVVPRAKKQRTIPDELIGFAPLPLQGVDPNNPSMLAHQHPIPPANHQQQQYSYNTNGAFPSASNMSAASGSRPIKPASGFQSVNEVIGGKVQEVFVIDDDSPPPSNPLSVQSARDPRFVNNYAHVNGHAAAPPYTSTLHGYASGSAVDPRYDPAAHLPKGKRKAQDNGAHSGLAGPHINMLPHDADLIAPAPHAGVHAMQAEVPLHKRRKRSHPVKPEDVLVAGGTFVPNDAAIAAHLAASGAAGSVPAKRHAPELAQARVAPNYRGGYPAGSGALDYATRYDPAAANAAFAQAHQHGYEGTASTRESFASSASYIAATAANTGPVDDDQGHFIVNQGDYVTSRYKILRLLGQGTFGKVVECYDKKLRKYVAIKIIRAVPKYRDASQIEIRVLRTLRENDPGNENKCIHLLETFNFKNHVCIVSELLGKSVFDFLKENKFQPFPPLHIWKFAKQLMQSVAFLHRLNLVHTDLKPENILLVSSEHSIVATSRRQNAKRKHVLHNTEIRLIDFGSAIFNDEFHSSVVSTRHYRAPEIILSMGWSFPCDVWSIGCILVEFFTGDALFQTHDNLEHLAMMEAVLGKMPDDYRRKAETYKPEYFKHGALKYPVPETSKDSRRYVRQMKKLQDLINGTGTSVAQAQYAKHNSRFLHLLRQLLEFDAGRRIKVQDALKHPYFDLDPEKDFPPI